VTCGRGRDVELLVLMAGIILLLAIVDEVRAR
jgi:hypothetical protein